MDIGIAFTGSARFEPSRLFSTDVLLATLLLSYADVFGSKTDNGARINLKRSQAKLAEAIGASERSVNRLLIQWKEQGLVTKASGHYEILKPAEMEALAGELAGTMVHRWRKLED